MTEKLNALIEELLISGHYTNNDLIRVLAPLKTVYKVYPKKKRIKAIVLAGKNIGIAESLNNVRLNGEPRKFNGGKL